MNRAHSELSLQNVERMMERYYKWRIVVVDARRRPIGIIGISDIADTEQYRRTGQLLREISSRDVRVF